MQTKQAVKEEKHVSSDADSKGAFRSDEKHLANRISEIVGEESQAAFARRCGFSDALLRKYLQGAEPSLLRAVRIAQAANVNLEWLATGRGPKARGAPESASVVTMPAPAEPRPVFDDLARLTATITAVQEGLASVNLTLPPAKYAELVAAAYELMGGSSEAAPAQSAHVVRFIRAAAR
jgi:hypothetical protein